MAPEGLRQKHRGWIRKWMQAALLWLWCCGSQWALAAPLITLDAKFDSVDLAANVDLLADPDGKLAIADVAQGAFTNSFKPARPAEFQHTQISSAYWLRFGVINPLPNARTLALNFRMQQPGKITLFSGSDLRELPTLTDPKFQLVIPQQSQQLFYLRVGPGGLQMAQIELASIDHMQATLRDHAWLGGLRQGGLAMLALFAVIMALLRREIIYVWLAIHSAMFQLFLMYFNTEISPGFFEAARTWNFLHPASQMILLAGLSSVRLALQFPIVDAPAQRRSYARFWLWFLLGLNLLAMPVLVTLPRVTAATLVLLISMTTVISTIAIALNNFLATHKRMLLGYALVRSIMLLLLISTILAWRAGGDAKSLLLDLLPLTILAETLGVMCLLLARSFQSDRARARAEREITALAAEGRARTEVLVEVGHRIRTPVSGVLGMLDMLQDTPLSAAQLDHLTTIRRASNELLNLVNEMSDITQLQSGSGALPLTAFDPQALVTECVDGFRSLARAHHLELISDPAPALPAYVSGDPTRVRQIVLQLLHQTISQRERGEIVFRIQPLPRPQWLQFCIETHAGTAQSALSEIDQRINPPGSANMRLAIARQLVELLGGRLTVREFNDGQQQTLFDLQLPEVSRSRQNPEHDSVLLGKQLLIIDDSATFCEVLRRQAGHWGMVVHIANSASEGLARLRNQITLAQPIDAVLADADMPELQQHDWIERMHAEIATPPLLVLLSSHPETNDAELLKLGVRHVLIKPINHNSLKITLAEEFKHRAKPLKAPPRQREQPIRCLFAEDNLINSKVLAGMLTKLGVDFTAVENGLDAVEACQRGVFDIVLMDCDMPVMDGWEASRHIRESFENRGLTPMPIIALTANTVEELGERARQPVMDAHLVKPINLQELRNLLERWTGKLIHPPASTTA
jgi:CheY-like chemotaxis protein/signal transduction histidine kinase